MSGFNRNPWIDWALKFYIALSFAFIFAPIAASFVFSFNVDRFPSLPLGGFSTIWYETVLADPLVWEGLRNTLSVGAVVSVVATAILPGCSRNSIWFALQPCVSGELGSSPGTRIARWSILP